MTWTASGTFAFANLSLAKKAISLTADTFKVALYKVTATPAKTVTTAALTEYNGTSSQWVTANEVSSTNYTAGGVAVSSPTLSQSTSTIKWTSSGTPSWTGVSLHRLRLPGLRHHRHEPGHHVQLLRWCPNRHGR